MEKITCFILSIVPCVFLNAQTTVLDLNKGDCIPPDITDTSSPGEICGGETATLTATTDGEEIYWFDAETGGNQLGEGSPFETEPLAQTTSFWVEARNFDEEGGEQETGGARVAPSNNSSSEVLDASTPWGLVFDADEPFVLNTVDVYLASNSPGDIIMQLKDSDLNILEEQTIALPAGNSSSPVQHEITLDFNIPEGTGYNLVASESPEMIREFSSGHPGFPYPIGDIGTVTAGTINDTGANEGVYYFFYNWSFTPGSYCASDREEVVVTVNEVAMPDGASEQTFSDGETLADLSVTGENLTWYEDEDGTTELPDTTPLEDGTTYYVSQTIDDCESALLAITVTLDLSNADFVFKSFTFYPNPVENELYINNDFNITKVELINLLGQTVLQKELNTTNTDLQMGMLQSGSYFLKVTSGNYTKTVQVLKK